MSYFSEPHRPLRCKHLYKGQVQCLRGLLLVSRPVRRSNEPSNQCCLFIAQSHSADAVTYTVYRSLTRELCVELHLVLCPDVWQPSRTNMTSLFSSSVLPNDPIPWQRRPSDCSILVFTRLNFSCRDDFSKC